MVRNSVYLLYLSLRLGFYGSPSVRFYGGVGKYTAFRQSSGGERLCLVCGPHCSVRKIPRTCSSLAVTAEGRALWCIVYIWLWCWKRGHCSCGAILGVSARGLGSVEVFIAHLQSENLSVGRTDEVLGLGA